MVARILKPGCKADMVPVLVGGQGAGKSEILKMMAPTPYHCVEACLTDPSSKLAHKTIGKTLVVWEELRGISGRIDADNVKTFITSDYMELPKKKGRGMDRLARRFIIFGTSNRYDFLRDPTGHRRYLPFDVRQINHDSFNADKEQLWAEALEIVRLRRAADESLVDFADAERLGPGYCKAFIKRGAWADSESLQAWLNGKVRRFSTAEALRVVGIVDVEGQKPSREMALSLRQLGYAEIRTDVAGYPNPLKRWQKAKGGSSAR